MMAGGMGLSTEANGITFVYPQGDTTIQPSMKLPAGGFFFDNIDRGGDFDEYNLDARKDFAHDFGVFDDTTATFLDKESKRLFEETSLGIVGMCGGAGFGDVFTLPAC